jgi:hypothetical protein
LKICFESIDQIQITQSKSEFKPMARSTSSLSDTFDHKQLREGQQSSSVSIKRSPSKFGQTNQVVNEVPLSAAAILSPPKSEYAIFLQSQSPKIRDCKEIVETRKQRLLDAQTKNLLGPIESPLGAAMRSVRSASPNRDKIIPKAANVAGSEHCNIKMGDPRVFAGSNL